METITIKELKKLATLLIDDGLNEEYTRGICELIADIDGTPELDHCLRAEQIKQELLTQKFDNNGHDYL